MAYVYRMKLWTVPLVSPIVDEDIHAETEKSAKAEALRVLHEAGNMIEYWMRPLGEGFYMYGIGQVWLGIISLQEVI